MHDRKTNSGHLHNRFIIFGHSALVSYRVVHYTIYKEKFKKLYKNWYKNTTGKNLVCSMKQKISNKVLNFIIIILTQSIFPIIYKKKYRSNRNDFIKLSLLFFQLNPIALE